MLPEDLQIRPGGGTGTQLIELCSGGGRAGTQLIVLCSAGGAGRNTAHCAVFWRRAGRDTAQRLRSLSLILGLPRCFLGASVAIPTPETRQILRVRDCIRPRDFILCYTFWFRAMCGPKPYTTIAFGLEYVCGGVLSVSSNPAIVESAPEMQTLPSITVNWLLFR